MALQTKIFTVGVVDDLAYNRFALDLILTEESVSEVENTSQVSYVLQLRSGSRNFIGFGLGAEIKLAGTVVAARDQKTAPQMSMQKYSTLEILSGTETILHSADGSLDMAVEFWINTPVEDYTPGKMEMTGASMHLTQIARASTITAYNADIEYPALIHISRKNDAYTHSVYCEFGKIAGYLNSDGVLKAEEAKFSKETIDFKIPTDFYTQIPDKPSAECTLTCRTYYGDTQIGAPQKAKFFITASERLCAPVVRGEVVDVNDKTIALTGDRNKLVKFMSNAQCKIEAEAKNESSLEKMTVTRLKEIVFEDSDEDGKAVAEIQGVETGKFTFRAVDSRGYESKHEIELEMIPYIPLTVNVSAARTDPTSGNAILTVEGACYTGEFSANKQNVITAKYCVANGDPKEFRISAENNRYRGQINVPNLDYRSQHTLKVTVRDLLMEKPGETKINKGIPVFDWGENDFRFNVPVYMADGMRLGDGALFEPQEDKIGFNVPVWIPMGINGIYMNTFSDREGQLWLTPDDEYKTQFFLIAGNGVLGILTANRNSCTWEGTDGIICQTSSPRCGLQFAGDAEGIILSNYPWRQDD